MVDSRKEARTIFTDKLFPEPIDGKISTAPFLEAASGVVTLVEQLGNVFAPVRYDINGNIQKLAAKYNENSTKYEYLNDMILCEKAEGGNRATDALVWLRRALHFVHNFLLSLGEDARANEREENLTSNVQMSYKETLERYHGWVAQRLFSVLSKMIPSRSHLMRAFALDEEGQEEALLKDLDKFLSYLNSNLAVLAKFYDDFNLNPPVS